MRDVGEIGMVQPNEGFNEKGDPAHADSVVGSLLDGSKRLADQFPRPRLIIWPEAAIPDFLWRRPQWVARITSLVRENHVPIFTGVVWADSTWRSRLDPYYNAAIFIDTTGNWRPYPVYAKHYLVPVTERVPFVAAGAHFLVNITNDAWFGSTSAPKQHASHLILRAIETRMGVARAANSGISEFVDPMGRTYLATQLDEKTYVAGVVRTTNVIPLYVRLGDWVGLLVVVFTLTGIVFLVTRRLRP